MVPGSSPGGPTKVVHSVSNINYKLQFKLFIIFTFFLLIEGFFYYYSYKLSYFCFEDFSFSNNCTSDYTFFDVNRSGFNPLIWNEIKLIESFQILFLVLTIYQLIKNIIIKNKYKFSRIFLYFLYFYTLGVIYFLFEEISWGQHYLKWETNKTFMILNNQGETNIHNISNIFDQLPRGILTLWCGFSIFLVKFLKLLPVKKTYIDFVFPSQKIKYISFILLIFLLPDLFVNKLNLHPGHSNYTYVINSAEIYDFFTLNFIRLSEFQELIFAFYIYHHTLFFKETLR